MRITVKNMVKQACAVCLACLLMLPGVLTVTAQAAEVTTKVQKAIFPFSGYVTITQLSSGYYPGTWMSHNIEDMYAMDITSPTTAYAPFNCRVVDVIKDWNAGNIVVIESTDKVYLADGSIEYVHVAFIHDDVINDNVYIGATFNRFDYFYDAGQAGNVTGPHIHIEARKGHYAPDDWRWGSCGGYPVRYLPGNGPLDPNCDPKNIFFVTPETYLDGSSRDEYPGELEHEYFYKSGNSWKDTGNVNDVTITTTTLDPFWIEGWMDEGSPTETDAVIRNEFHYSPETNLNRVGCFMSTDANAVANATPDSYKGVWAISEDASGWQYGTKDGYKWVPAYYSAQGDPASALGFGQTLSPGTTYYYKFFATLQGYGQVYMSAVDSFTTTGGTVEPPSPTPPTTTVTTKVQKAIWPFIGEVRINQLSSGIYAGNWVSHGIADMFAIDANVAGAVAYAPFDCRVVDVLPDWGNIAVIESVAPVYLADGSMDYVHVAFVHDDNIDNLIAAYNTGAVITQWTPIYDEGTTAGNGWTVNRHIHLEARRGKYENYKGASGTVSYGGRPTGFSLGNCGAYTNIVYLAGNTSTSDPKNIFFGATGYGTYFNCSAVNDWEGEVDNGYFQYWKYTDSFTQEITTTTTSPHWHDGSWINEGTLTDNDVQVEHRFYYPGNTSLGISGCFMGTDENAVANASTDSHNGVWMVSEDASGWGSSDAGNGMRWSRIYYSAQGDPASALGFGQTLSPGTTYYYKFFITWQGNGQVYTSDVSNFTTTGTAAIKPETLTYSVLTYNAEDNADYYLYPTQANNIEIRKEILAGEPNAAYTAAKSAAVLHSDGKRYRQTFTFSNVLAGEYKLVTYKPRYGVRIRDVGTDTTDLDVIEMTPSGDITGEGKINSGDLQKLFQHVNKKITLEQEYIPSADVNGDGKVNGGDLQRLFQFINKRIDTLE